MAQSPVPYAGPTHQRHLNFIRTLNDTLVIRNADSTELEVNAIPLGDMLVRLNVAATRTSPITGTYRVVAILDPHFFREFDNLIVHMSVSCFLRFQIFPKFSSKLIYTNCTIGLFARPLRAWTTPEVRLRSAKTPYE
jgi:hypothetical protein